MLDKLFGNVDLLQKGLDASWMRNEVISNNIANAETPNFKSSGVQFETVFKSALEDFDARFQTKRTRDEHISFSDEMPVEDVTPAVVPNAGTTMRMDGNNVDIEAENVNLAKNQILYYTLTEQMNSDFTRLSMAINEGK